VNSLRGAKLAERAAIAPALTLAATAAGGPAFGAAMTRAAPNTAVAKATAASRAISAPASLTETATTLSALDGTLLREAIVANKAILWPFWCELIPDWAFCWQELVEVPLQSDGSFWAEICFWCPEDFPDLYFEVLQRGVEIYDPQIACSTYYNYDGSQSVDIVIDDPRAVACIPDPGRPVPGNDLLVWPLSIGFELLENISGLESPPDSGPLPGNTTGQLSGNRPFGGSLAIKMWFDYRLKTNSSLRYYRWSYKFDDEVDFGNIPETVTHRYGTFIPTGILAHPVTLGPKTVGATVGLFDIPDPNPGDTGWINGDDRQDAPFAYFDSTGNKYPPFIYTDLAVPPRKSGMCTLKLEMFDAGGNFVPCGNLNPGVFKFVLPDLGTPNTYTTTLTGNNITPAGALVFRVRIDNNDTTAQLNGVTASGLYADNCGILHYPDGSALVDV
jgi:hypothetical protein